MVDTCLVTGTIVAPDGTPLRRTFMLFQRLPEEAFVADDATGLPTPVTKRTEDDGSIEVELIPGAYLVKQWYSRHDYFRIDVPDEPTARLEDIQDDILQPPPSRIIEAVGEAKEARDAAVGAKGAAEEAADRAEAARAAARTIFPDTADGLAATTDGDYFSVPSPDDDEYLILYRNDSGSATEIRRYPSTEALATLAPIERPVFTGGVSTPLANIGDAALTETEGGFAIEDADGNRVFEIGPDGAARMVQAILDAVRTIEASAERVSVGESSLTEGEGWPWAITDREGNVLFGLGEDLVARMLSAYVGAALLEAAPQGWAWAVGDAEGNIVCGVTDEGEFRAIGLEPGPGPGPEPITQEVFFAFAEPWTDPSQDLAITWVADNDDHRVMLYRPQGTSQWMSTTSRRSRAWPNYPGNWLHTAVIDGLGPDALYELAWPGAELQETVKTAPLVNLRVCVASDYQRYSFGESSLLAQLGEATTDEAVDLVIWNGDFINDDGQFDLIHQERWFGFLKATSDFWRTSGALIPMVGVIGNHEGRNAAGTSNAMNGGDGTPGPMPELFSLGFDPEHPNYENRSVYSFSVGKELFVAVLETDHTVPLPSQVGWLEEQLNANAPKHRNVIVCGHSPAFHSYWEAWDRQNTQARVLRNEIWPVMQQHAGKVRAYFCGHEHRLAVSAPLRMDPDPNLGPLENDRRFWTDPEGGIRQLGTGPTGGSRNVVDPDLAGLTSTLDGSPRLIAALGVDTETNTPSVYGTGITNITPNYFHVWIADFSATEFKAKAILPSGLPLYELAEAL